MPNCPNCGKPMSPGFLGSESFIGGSKWFLERTRLAFGGEEIAPPNTFGMVYIAGFRCRDCKTLLLQYGGAEKPPASDVQAAAPLRAGQT